MMVKKYKCTYCLNETYGPEIKPEEGFCLVCGKQGTLEVDNRDWNVEPKAVPSVVPKGAKWPP